MNEIESTKMIFPCSCPHCGQDIIIDLNQPHPTIDITTPEEVPDDIKEIIENEHDITETPEAA